jgi:hypothetical protein
METKICKKCGVEKNINEFNLRVDSKDGHRNECKICKNDKDKIYYTGNITKKLIYQREYSKNNHEHIKLWVKKYREENKEKINEIARENSKKYREKYKDIINERNRKNRKIKYDTSPINKLTRCVRHRLNEFLKERKINKRNKTFNIIGCSPLDLKIHLEKQFKEGMCWENYGFYGWHIDHIIPLSSGKTEIEILKLSHYTNLQPLWSNENFKKGKRYAIDDDRR